jgi:hypothetical protein
LDLERSEGQRILGGSPGMQTSSSRPRSQAPWPAAGSTMQRYRQPIRSSS